MKISIKRLFVIGCVSTLFALAPINWVHAQQATPTAIQGVEIVTSEQAKALIGKAQFFDFRSAVNFGKGHIAGSQAMPYKGKSENVVNFDAAQDQFELNKLPNDKKAVLVFFSDGPTGWKSYKAAVIASKAGYSNVRWMREGIAGWSAKGYKLK